MDISIYLNALTALFVMIDPIGAAIIFHALLPVGDHHHRVLMAVKAVVISTLLLLVFGNYGEVFLDKLGISIEALRISGGLLLFYTAFNMITADSESPKEAATKKDISVFPMSIPMLAGPGSLTLCILLFSEASSQTEKFSVLFAILTISALTLVLMLLSKYVRLVIGSTGDEILRRFLGVILAALAIQFIYEGIRQLMMAAVT